MQNWRERKLTIAVAINNLGSIQQPAYSNHIQLFYRWGRFYPNITFCLINPPRMSIDRMRNMSSEVVLRSEFDYLLFLDDDVLIPFSHNELEGGGLAKLLDVDAGIAAGNVIIRGYPFNYMLFKYDEDGIHLPQMEELPLPLGVIDVDAVGFSFCLIKREVLLDTPKPHFITGERNTEDIYFCLKAKKANKDLTIKADTSIICHHILWPEMMSMENRENYKFYMEQQYPQQIEQSKNDRGKDYYELVTGESLETD